MPQVPAMQNESSRSSRATSTIQHCGVHQDPKAGPYEIAITGIGRTSILGWCPSAVVCQHVTKTELSGEEASFTWCSYHIPFVQLEYAASLQVLQGMPLGQLFVGILFHSPTYPEVNAAKGSFTFLTGKLSPIYQQPLKILDVSLGQFLKSTVEIPPQELMGLMLQKVLVS